MFLFGIVLVLNADAQIRWGLKIGGNLSSLNAKEEGVKIEGLKSRFGFHASTMMEWSFISNFALQPELQFIANGFNWEINGKSAESVINAKFKGVMYQLQLPVNLKYKVGSNNVKFFATTGPYAGLGIYGKLLIDKYLIDGKDYSKDLELEYKDIDLYNFIFNNELPRIFFQRFDFGINAGIGVEIYKFIIGVNYQTSLINISGVANSNYKMGTFQFSAGYFF